MQTRCVWNNIYIYIFLRLYLWFCFTLWRFFNSCIHLYGVVSDYSLKFSLFYGCIIIGFGFVEDCFIRTLVESALWYLAVGRKMVVLKSVCCSVFYMYMHNLFDWMIHLGTLFVAFFHAYDEFHTFNIVFIIFYFFLRYFLRTMCPLSFYWFILVYIFLIDYFLRHEITAYQ